MSPFSMQLTPRLDYVVCTSPSGLYRMAYWEWGDPNNSRVLLCAHGLMRTGRDFDELAKALSSHYRVICPDIVGRGESDHLVDPDGYVLSQYVADIFTLLARLQPSSIDWVGTSMGGLIGLGVASALVNAQRLLAWGANDPFNVSWIIPFGRLVLNDVGPVINTEGLARLGNYIDADIEFDTYEEVISYAKKYWASFGEHSDAQWEHLARYVFTQRGGKWVSAYDIGIAEPFKKQLLQQNEDIDQAVADSAQSVLWHAYENLPAEVLVVRGSESDLLSKDTAAEMLQRNKKASLYEVPQVGHAPMLMQPEQIEAVKQFLLKGSS